jgi:polyhydroxyalkanoate synthesis regulator phasin
MKKILVMCILMVSVFTISANAQFGGQGGDTTGRAQRMKEIHDRLKTGLVDQAKLTSDEADKVIDIYMSRTNGMRGMRDLSEEDRKKKMDEMQADAEKKYKAIPLTDDKIKAVNDYLATQMRNRGPRPQQPSQQ